MPISWEVRFCDRCFAAYDVEPPSKRKVCDDCLHQKQLGYVRSHRERETASA
jgi:hypothetical protein